MSQFAAAAHTAQEAAFETISGSRAAEMITTGSFEDTSIVGFDEVEAGRLGVKLHQVVSVTPDDNGLSNQTLAITVR